MALVRVLMRIFSPMPNRYCLWFACCVAGLGLGCGSQGPADPYGANAAVAEFGTLKLSRTVNDSRVQRPLAELESQQQLPDQLAEAYRQQTDAATAQQVADFFESTSQSRIDQALAQSAAWWNPAHPASDLLVASQGAEFLKAWEPQRTAARGLLTRPGSRLPAKLEEGYLSDPKWMSMLHCLARAELLNAAHEAGDGKLADAVTSVAFALAYGDRLNQIPLVSARNYALPIRQECFVTLRALLRHPDFRAEHLATLEAILQQTLDAWPEDDQVWQGDRACGLHFFEMIRAGHFASLLTRDEYEELTSSGQFSSLVGELMRNITADQAFYLASMEQVVQLARKPYPERIDGLTSIAQAIDQTRGTKSYPQISGEFLLQDLHAHHAAFAKDKAQTLIWLVAVQTARGKPPANALRNPFNGQPLQIEDEPGRVVAHFTGLPGEIPDLVIPKYQAD